MEPEHSDDLRYRRRLQQSAQFNEEGESKNKDHFNEFGESIVSVVIENSNLLNDDKETDFYKALKNSKVDDLSTLINKNDDKNKLIELNNKYIDKNGRSGVYYAIKESTFKIF